MSDVKLPKESFGTTAAVREALPADLRPALEHHAEFIGEKGREVVSEAEKIKTQVMSLFVLAIFLILSGMASVLGFFVAVAFGGVGFPFPSWLIVVVLGAALYYLMRTITGNLEKHTAAANKAMAGRLVGSGHSLRYETNVHGFSHWGEMFHAGTAWAVIWPEGAVDAENPPPAALQPPKQPARAGPGEAAMGGHPAMASHGVHRSGFGVDKRTTGAPGDAPSSSAPPLASSPSSGGAVAPHGPAAAVPYTAKGDPEFAL